MTTIDALITESNGVIDIEKKIRRDEVVDAVYSKHPDLALIDNEIIKSRSDALLAAFDDEPDREKFFDGIREELKKKRSRYLEDHGIPADFDEVRDVCSKCHDTGYYVSDKGVRQVCNCREKDLEACFKACGMGDYSTYTLESYDSAYFGNKSKRAATLRKLVNSANGNTPDTPLMLYSDSSNTGKTYLAVCVTKAMIKTGKSAAFIKAEKLGSLYSEDLYDYKELDLVVIDDFAPELTKKNYIASNLNELLERRIADHKPTIIITSDSRESILDDCDVRIASKLSRAGTV